MFPGGVRGHIFQKSIKKCSDEIAPIFFCACVYAQRKWCIIKVKFAFIEMHRPKFTSLLSVHTFVHILHQYSRKDMWHRSTASQGFLLVMQSEEKILWFQWRMMTSRRDRWLSNSTYIPVRRPKLSLWHISGLQSNLEWSVLAHRSLFKWSWYSYD